MPSIKYAVDVDTRGARSSLAQLERSISNVGLAVAGGFAGGALVQFADSITGLRNKLSAFSVSQEEVNQKFNTIVGIAGRARSDLGAVGDLYGKMTVASQALGLSQDQVAQITETFTKSLKVGGATAQESASAILQFSQAMGSGVLRGEEFNAVMEASPSTMMDLAKALNVPVGSLRKLAEEGKLTSKVVAEAMLKMQTEVENKFKKTVPTIGDALNNVRTAAASAFNDLSQEPGITKLFIDAAKAVIQLTTDVNKLAETIKSLVPIAVSAATAFFLIPKALGGTRILLDGLSKGLIGLASGGAFTRIIGNFMGIKNSLNGVLDAFGPWKSATGQIMVGVGKDAGKLAQTFGRLGQVVFSLSAIFTSVLRIGLRFAGMVGVVLTVLDVFNLLYKAIRGTNENLIDTGKVLKFFIDLVKILWWAIKGLANIIVTGLSTAFNWLASSTGVAGNVFRGFLSTLGLTGVVVKTVIGWIGALWGKLGEFWGWLKEKSGIAAQDRKDALDKQQADLDAKLEGMGLGKSSVQELIANRNKPKPGTSNLLGGDDSKQKAAEAKKKIEEQAKALQEVKKAVLDITAAFRQQASARLADLDFQKRSLDMSENAIQLEQNRTDILKEQQDALKQLAERTQELEDKKKNKEISNQGYREAIALIQQETAAVNAAAEAQLAASEKEIKAIQARNLEIDAATKKMELLQQANENRAALQALEDQLSLVGLYGDKLDEATAQLELQNKLREIEVEYQNQLLDLENQRTKLGAERYAMELANIQAIKSQSTQAAMDQAAAQKKLADATKKSERTDVTAAIRKRNEELQRSIDPVVTALESYNSVFDNMSNALDNFIETGKFKFSDFARSIILDLAKIAAKAALTKIFTGITTAIFGHAAGGPVQGDKPYLVGENGPELFVPGSNGSIMTNASLNKNAGMDQGAQPVVNNTYITNNISAIDSRSVAQMFVENRKSLLGATTLARKEMPY